MTVVVVDDMRSFVPEREGVIYLRNSQDAIAYLSNSLVSDEIIDELWLDHDLSLKSSEDGIAVARFIEDSIEIGGHRINIKAIYIHTSNPSGRHRMTLCLQDHYKVYQASAHDVGLLVTEEA